MRFALLLAILASAAGAQSPPARLILRPLAVPAKDTNDHVDVGPNKTVVVVAVAYDSSSRMLSNQKVTWSILDTNIARISGSTANGTIHAKNYGSTFLTATVRGKTAMLPICVYDASYKGGVKVLGPAFITQGMTGQYMATTNDGTPFVIPCIHWSTSDPSSVGVNHLGIVLGRKTVSNALVTAFLGTP